MTGHVPCPRNCHKDCPHNTAASGCPRILYEDRIVELENALAKTCGDGLRRRSDGDDANPWTTASR